MQLTVRSGALTAMLFAALLVFASDAHAAAAIGTVPGMPPVTDPSNLYSETGPDKLSPAVANVPARVYVPNVKSDEVHVIDPVTLQVIDRFKVGRNPQHIVPSWDLKTLWVTTSITPTSPSTARTSS